MMKCLEMNQTKNHHFEFVDYKMCYDLYDT